MKQKKHGTTIINDFIVALPIVLSLLVIEIDKPLVNQGYQGYSNRLILASSLPIFLGTLTVEFLFSRNEN